MNYPENIEQKIGFEEIRILLKTYCQNSLSATMVDDMAFSNNYEEIRKKLLLTDEMKKLIYSEIPFHLSEYFDVLEELKRIKTKGSFIELQELQNLKISLETATYCLSFFQKEEIKKDFPALSELSVELFLEPNILQSIHKILNKKGEISNNASPELKNIRLTLSKKKKSVESRIMQALETAKKNNYVDKETNYSVLNDRPVIPGQA